MLSSKLHDRICSPHRPGLKILMLGRLWGMGYPWPTIMDSLVYVRCKACQYHANCASSERPLHPTAHSWPFQSWGVDIIGPINPPCSRGHYFTLVAAVYFSKCAEAVILTEVKTKSVLNFLQVHLIYTILRPLFLSLLWAIHNFQTRIYGIPLANGLVEAFIRLSAICWKR